MDSERPALTYAVAAAMCWSTVASAFKLALRQMSVLALLQVASLTAVFLVLGLVVAQGRFREFLSQSKADWMNSAVLGFLNPFLYYMVLLEAYRRLPAQEAQPLNNIWPVVLSLLAVPILKQRLTSRMALPLLVSFFGVVVISVRGDFANLRVSDPIGCSLALGSSVVWALFWLGNTRDRRRPTVRMLTNFVAGALYIHVAMLFFRHDGVYSPLSMGSAVYVGCFEMGITFLLWGRAVALSRGSAAVNNVAYLSPFLSLILIHFIVGERILPSSVMGLTLIIGGILLQTVWRNQSLSGGAGTASPPVDRPAGNSS